MQTIEVLVYFLIAVIVAGSLVSVILTLNHDKQYHDFVDVLSSEEENVYKIESTEFPSELVKRWEDCRYGLDNMSFSVYVKDSANLTRAGIINELTRIDKCDVIDCKNNTNSLFINSMITTQKL